VAGIALPFALTLARLPGTFAGIALRLNGLLTAILVPPLVPWLAR